MDGVFRPAAGQSGRPGGGQSATPRLRGQRSCSPRGCRLRAPPHTAPAPLRRIEKPARRNRRCEVHPGSRNPGPALDNSVAVCERGPSRVNAGDRCPSCPECVHGREITRRERPVKLEIGGKHGILIGHRDPQSCCRTIRRWRACRQSIDSAAHCLGTAACSFPAQGYGRADGRLASILLSHRGRPAGRHM